ncbi:MAG: regulatory protein RecX [Caldisericota bacterium]|nr:regulatory protein RecX [Caldisericota bacterium]
MHNDEQSAFNYSLYLLSFKDYSEYELRKKLVGKFDVCFIDNTITKLKEKGLLSDKQYVEKIIRRYGSIKKYGYFKVEHELRRRGLKKEVYENLLNEIYTEAKEEENALSIAFKRPREKLGKYLLSRGYRSYIVRKVLALLEKE